MIGNLPQTNDDNFTVIPGSTVKATAFTLPAGNNYSLDNAILRLGDYESGDVPLVQIRNDVGGSDPGSTVLTSFTNPTAQGSGIFNYTFTPTAPFTFIAGTKYWLYVQSSSGSFEWRFSVPSTTPTGIATSSGNRLSNGGSFVNSSFFNSFQINATEITGPVASTPEPTAIAALSLFGLGLLGIKGRRNEG
ncbi:MAG: PEP-CTERM sorting domain-containing protein [Microcystis wesenbergii Mw_MB_S_20031200_S109]|uniref:PEP-CTERM sorting domain-containing protein n=1 Tax=Microcystis wesenbergii Mw_MB_S_20031200_S109D TaxID=2486241 RepID=A0A552LQT2_9CHRO|nr:MAG: PEP-CTERM sorting domain-containing protein [Microcystis wesenbergii Mw_MB_S_20031200_S109]TRV22554.1 MAG: PEP-CTERM sorting domain-containing protein [Microcystis wesenbergii Mw_MB_S_20031200_S109D]